MINPNNIQQLTDSLECALGREVFPFELEILSDRQRAYIASLCYRWTQGETIKDRIETIINHPPRPRNELYRKQKGLV